MKKSIQPRRNDSGSPISPENSTANFVRFGGTPRASDMPHGIRDRRFFESALPSESLPGHSMKQGRNSLPGQQ